MGIKPFFSSSFVWKVVNRELTVLLSKEACLELSVCSSLSLGLKTQIWQNNKMWDISAWKDIEANMLTQVNSCFATAAGGKRHVQFRGMSRVSSSSLGDDSSSPLLFLTFPNIFFFFFRNNSLKVVSSNFLWRLSLLFSPSDCVPQRSAKGLGESLTLTVKRPSTAYMMPDY